MGGKISIISCMLCYYKPLIAMPIPLPAEDARHGQQDRGAHHRPNLRQPAIRHAGGQEGMGVYGCGFKGGRG